MDCLPEARHHADRCGRREEVIFVSSIAAPAGLPKVAPVISELLLFA